MADTKPNDSKPAAAESTSETKPKVNLDLEKQNVDFKTQIDSLTKQQSDLQKQLAELKKTNDDLLKTNEQLYLHVAVAANDEDKKPAEKPIEDYSPLDIISAIAYKYAKGQE